MFYFLFLFIGFGCLDHPLRQLGITDISMQGFAAVVAVLLVLLG